jgi:uncharacterized metal-binding protein
VRVVVKPLPALYACEGCPEFGQIARDVGALLDRRGIAEMVWLGGRVGAAPDSKPTSRFPIFALDGCTKACARRWLERYGVTAQRHFVLGELEDVEHAAERIAARC